MGDIFGGSDGQVVVSNTGGGPPQILSEFQPFAQKLGELATRALNFPELDLRRFAADQTLPIAGLSPLEEQLRGMISQRGTEGIPVPYPELAAFASTSGSLDTAANLANRTSGGGANMISPLVQNTIANLEANVRPVIENSAAKFGLAQSGQLPAELGKAYAGALSPIYQQGMQHEITGQQALINAQLAATNPFLTMGQREEQRPVQQMNELSKMGELERNIEQSRNLASMDSYNRAREMGLGLVNPFGSFTAAPQPASQTKTTTSGGGLSFGK